MEAKESENFGLLPKEFSAYDKSKVVIIPVPYEATTTYGKGTSMGPDAIIKASQNMELYDEVLKKNTAEIGICTLKPLKIDKKQNIIEAVEKKVYEVLGDGKFPIILGGEHSLSLGAFYAIKEVHRDFSILHIDAHADLRDEYENNKHSHACVMCRALEKDIHSVSVGIRSLSDEESATIMGEELDIFYAHDILNKNDCNYNNWHEEVLSKLKKKVYITLDVDGLDPSIMPSTGTPEPGGFDWYSLTNFLQKVFNEKEIIGFDVVELSPIKGLNAPDFTAAKLIYRMIGFINS